LNFSATAVTELHDQLTVRWHESPQAESYAGDDLMQLIAMQHRANFDLWHTEDEARRPGATDCEITDVKRRIDATNQQRNDLVEQIDGFLLQELSRDRLPTPSAPLNSETPGLIIDRLSILALKIFHTQEEAERKEAPAGHAERNVARLGVLKEQRADLAECLDALWRETLSGTRRFKLYRQMKMYNDPDLNPAIYRKP
jgi:hypothetical protein